MRPASADDYLWDINTKDDDHAEPRYPEENRPCLQRLLPQTHGRARHVSVLGHAWHARRRVSPALLAAGVLRGGTGQGAFEGTRAGRRPRHLQGSARADWR